ncbi:uncharacterized membrane protein [Rhizobium subbaraonis]|uniref:Uncharacterized membrane protein n=1 Tax=Rhizobium subbaraonis TaxID=908946 RepID=A0A285UF22_9HYPH|nr:anthrone oxygenase family protein [Rhizobium subbaraonis]SOC40422.1 uncharacterized membrane protein [Rhizobium subbaraonis]
MAAYTLLLLVATVGAGLNAGLFFIFSVCIMAALARLPAGEGIAAMNAINVVIQNPLFFAAFMGTALLAVAIIVLAFLNGAPGSALAIGAAAVFLVGTLGVTIVFNVPMNDALAAVNPASPEGEALWKTYLGRWTAWNHVRTVTSIASLVLFILAYARAT